MKKEITLGQALAIAVTLLTTIITAWVTLNNRVTAQGERINSMEAIQARAEKKLDRIDDKLDIIIIKVENKKDR